MPGPGESCSEGSAGPVTVLTSALGLPNLRRGAVIVEATGLTKTFASRNAPVRALRGIDLEVSPKARSWACWVLNGAGKTTTINVLTTLLRRSGG